ncbi:MAG: tail fiber domain-containing protein [Bacteroidales bacterium]|nr:tail fiber domain-containing protein [Bacteroidales bacterium]
MKRIKFSLWCVFFFCFSSAVFSQLKVTPHGHLVTDYNLISGSGAGPGIYIGKQENPSLTPAERSELGQWGIEESDGGLNFWRPYPNTNFGNYFIFIAKNGNVGIGRNPSYKLDVNGSIAISGQLKLSSDARLKRNIQPLSLEINKIYRLNAKTYEKTLLPANSSELDAKKGFPMQKTLQKESYSPEFGYLAQELKEIYPELVDQDAEGYYTINYIGLIPVIIEALKEQKKELDALKAENMLFPKEKSLSPAQAETKITTGISSGIVENCSLYQNTPNPFTEKTEIRYYIPAGVKQALICVFDMQGKMLNKWKVSPQEQSLTIEGSQLEAGMYLYSLIVDDYEVDTKRMILTK